MFFFFSKALSIFTQPIGWCLLLLVGAQFLKHKKTLYTLAFAIFWITSTGAFSEFLARYWEKPVQKIETVIPKTYGVVLTGGLIKDPPSYRTGVYLDHSSDRIYQAFRLYKAGKIKKILISGGDTYKLDWCIENTRAKDALVSWGVKPEDVYQEFKSLNTFENATFSARFFQNNKLEKDIFLITSASHLKRAEACFRKQGFKLNGFSSIPEATYGHLRFSDFLPDAEEAYRSKLLIKEIIGYMVYKLQGYL